ncbi:MAG: hypothetical protein ACXVB4_16390 [Pseudobdellovibrionaceae bacterium]
MKKNIFFNLSSFATIVIFFSECGEADQSRQLSEYFEQKINQVQSRTDSLKDFQKEGATHWVLQDINIDLNPTVNFGINEVLSLTISPEIDFVLEPNQDLEIQPL